MNCIVVLQNFTTTQPISGSKFGVTICTLAHCFVQHGVIAKLLSCHSQLLRKLCWAGSARIICCRTGWASAIMAIFRELLALKASTLLNVLGQATCCLFGVRLS